MIYVIGPGHGGPGPVAQSYLEGSYTERYPNIERNRNGMQRLFRQFSWPYGIPSHVAPETPGSIHEGGELGYALVHAYGAAFDNPDLIVACVVGDGEAETGPLAASWHSNKFLNPRTRRRGAADPAPERIQDRQPDRAGADQPRGADATCCAATATSRILSRAMSRALVHQDLAAALDAALADIRAIQAAARAAPAGEAPERPRWPMIVLKTPKGWTGSEVRRRPAGGGHLARPPGAAGRVRQPRPRRPAGGLDAELPAARALRRARQVPRGVRRDRPHRPPPHERQPARQRRRAARPPAMPHFRDYAVEVSLPARSRPRRRACSATSCATSSS